MRDVEREALALVLAIWREVLAGDAARLTADSNFFLSGGDSLDLMRVLVRIRERFGVELDLRDAVAFSTPRKMARCCAGVSRQGRHEQVSGPLAATALDPDLDMAGHERFPASSGQRALWLAERMSAAPGLYNTAAILHVSGPLDVDALRHALLALLRRHEVLRSRLQVEWPGARLVNFITADPQLVLEPEPAVDAARAHSILLDAAAQPFDLKSGPLWRFRLLQLAGESWVLLLCLHHAVTDGWSGGVLLQHLADAYNARLIQHPQPGPLDTGFRRWVLGMRPTPEPALRWWLDHLDGADAVGSWPPTGALTWPFRMACEELLLDGNCSVLVGRAARALGMQQSALFLAALRLAVHELSGRRELCIAMPVNVRDASAQERSVGYFVNLLVLRGRMDPASGPGALAHEAQRGLANALQHRAVPFADLVQRMRPALLPSGNPWCDVLFAFQNLPQPKPVFTGLCTSVETLAMPLGQHPLKLEIRRVGAAYACRLEYANECLTQADARRLLEALRGQVARLTDAACSS